MRNDIVFISHSSKTEAALKEPLAIHDALTRKGYKVFLDRKTIEPGHEWRAAMLASLTQCSAAVLVLSEDAVASEFVRFEASVLVSRMSVVREFKLIPVLVPPVDEKVLANAAFAPLDLNAVQCLKGSPKHLAKKIARMLGAPPREPSTDEERLAEKISALLSGLTYAQLEFAYRRLGVPPPPWPRGDQRETPLGLALARLIVEGGVARLLDAISALGRESLPGSAWITLITLIAAFWTRREAALALKKAAIDEPKPAIALNGNYLAQFTAVAHANRAFWEQLERVKPLSISNAAGLDFGQHVIDEVRGWEQRLGINTRDTELRCVVTLPPPLVDCQTLSEIRTNLPGVLFVAGCGGTSPTEATAGRLDVVPLVPAVDLADEKWAYGKYRDAMAAAIL